MVHERYELADVIGSGGMATVWRATDTRLGRVVALKRPHPALPGSVTLTRFAREARAAATVSHPHLVAVYDAGEDDLGPYLVMEFVDGPSLASGSPSDSIASLGAQIASALAALHAAGIVHGDVKPGNVLLSSAGAKLTDFGIARSADDTSALTQPGIALGTPAYAAPETIATGARTASADVYSLAALLHELVTGTRWNPAGGSTQAMPPEAWRPALEAALVADPARRPSAAAFATALTELEALANPDAATVPIGVIPIAPAPPTDLPATGRGTTASATDSSPTGSGATAEPTEPKVTSNHAPPGTPDPKARRTGATAAILVAVVTIAMLAVAGWVGSRGSVIPSETTAPSAATETVEPSTAVADEPAVSAPTPDTVPPETTVPPEPTAVPTAAPPPTATDIAGELVVLIGGRRPRGPQAEGGGRDHRPNRRRSRRGRGRRSGGSPGEAARGCRTYRQSCHQ